MLKFGQIREIRKRKSEKRGDVVARISKSQLTRLEIIQVATRMFLERGYTKTTTAAICGELEMSKGNLTFHYPTKEHLLAVLTDMLCKFQWKLMEVEANEGISSVMAICLELMSMASACEENEVAKDFFIATYSSPITLDIIRKNDAERAKKVFADYCKNWTDEQFAGAEILVSGIEYATLMTTDDTVPLDVRITGALNQILTIYNVPEEIRKRKIEKVLETDYRGIGKRILNEFIGYVEMVNEQAFEELLSTKIKRKKYGV